jgi:hypothetical protein
VTCDEARCLTLSMRLIQMTEDHGEIIARLCIVKGADISLRSGSAGAAPYHGSYLHPLFLEANCFVVIRFRSLFGVETRLTTTLALSRVPTGNACSACARSQGQ